MGGWADRWVNGLKEGRKSGWFRTMHVMPSSANYLINPAVQAVGKK